MTDNAPLTLADIKSREAALNAEIKQLKEQRFELEQRAEINRENNLGSLVNEVITRLGSDGLQIVNIGEGVYPTDDSVIEFAPHQNNNQVSVQLYSVRNRKDRVDATGKVDHRNPSYKYNEAVAVTFFFPRPDLASHLENLDEERQA